MRARAVISTPFPTALEVGRHMGMPRKRVLLIMKLVDAIRAGKKVKSLKSLETSQRSIAVGRRRMRQTKRHSPRAVRTGR